MQSCHYLIYGKVQGVGFRAYTRREAKLLGLSGKIRNLHDGRVEVLAFGKQPQLDLFEKILRSGPPHARVDKIEVKLGPITTLRVEADFVLLEDGENPWP